jgi:putative hydrolase of the HAD superfamily
VNRRRSSHAELAVLVDIGGVLRSDGLPALAAAWSSRLGISECSFLDAIFGGSDEKALTGRMTEPAWWTVVGDRLGVSSDSLAELRRDTACAGTWNGELLAYLRRLRGQARTAVVSNAWPHVRTGLREAGLEDAVDEVLLSCEVGCAKPDPRIFLLALRRLGAAPEDALLVDDVASHVAAAESAGLTGYLHLTSAGTITRIERFLSSGAPADPVAAARGRALPGEGGRTVAVQDLGLAGVPHGGGPVGVQDQRPAPFVDHDLVVEAE